MKFLVLWELDLARVGPEMVRAIARMPEYGTRLEHEGKVLSRFHLVGKHGGAWTYDVSSHEEFERLLGRSPVFNFARYTVYAWRRWTGSPPTPDPVDTSSRTRGRVLEEVSTRSGGRARDRGLKDFWIHVQWDRWRRDGSPVSRPPNRRSGRAAISS